jgi:multimeric flavodoxin WrbA
VKTDMGDGDDWPGLRERLLKADILVVATPIWMGQTPSTTHRLLERLDAELSETKSDGTPTLFGKVAIVGVVGNEDGAHHVTAEVFQGLNDVGFSIPAQGGTYWVGEAMGSVDFTDLEKTPDAVAEATAIAARNAAHLAELLQKKAYPAESSDEKD